MSSQSTYGIFGQVHAIDALGRIVIPKPIRERMGIQPGDMVEIATAPGDGGILVRKWYPDGDFERPLSTVGNLTDMLQSRGLLKPKEANELRRHINEIHAIMDQAGLSEAK